MDIQKEREAFECEFKQTDYYIAHGDLSTLMLCDDQYALDDVQVAFEMWQAAKAEAGLRWTDINERMPERGQKVLIYRPFAHEKPHGDPNIRIATYCGEGVWINSHFEHVITYWMPISSPHEELPFI